MGYNKLIENTMRPVNLYSYGDLRGLTKEELFFCVVVEVVCEHLGTKDVAGIAAIILGAPILETRAKPAGAIPGTSLASIICRKLIDIRTTQRLPTLVGLFKVSYVKHLGAFVGRWIPVIGYAIMAYDLVVIDFTVVLRYNSLVMADDRIYDASSGTL